MPTPKHKFFFDIRSIDADYNASPLLSAMAEANFIIAVQEEESPTILKGTRHVARGAFRGCIMIESYDDTGIAILMTTDQLPLIESLIEEVSEEDDDEVRSLQERILIRRLVIAGTNDS